MKALNIKIKKWNLKNFCNLETLCERLVQEIGEIELKEDKGVLSQDEEEHIEESFWRVFGKCQAEMNNSYFKSQEHNGLRKGITQGTSITWLCGGGKPMFCMTYLRMEGGWMIQILSCEM